MIAAAALLVIHVYNAFRVAPADLGSARAAARSILEEAGLQLVWYDCSAPHACDRPLGPGELIVRILAAPPGSEPLSLGYSFVDPARQGGTMATLFADRVAAAAASAHVSSGLLLGRAVAHEIVHLLARTDHASTGLMRERWTAEELVNGRPGDWRLSPDDRRLIRRALGDGVGAEDEKVAHKAPQVPDRSTD